MTPEQEELVRQTAPDWNIEFGRTADIDKELYREAEIICGWNDSVQTEALDENAKLRWVQSWSSGIDSYPLELLEKHEIMLTDASGVHAPSVSETVLAMMLGLTRGIHRAVRNQQANEWNHGYLSEMNGGTVAVIGAGMIGREVARLSRAFGMRVIGVRRSGTPSPDVDVMYDMSGLDAALQESDYVVNILPLTPETKHVFDAARFVQMKKTAYFINVGRGGTVRTEALIDALQSGAIAGAGLDVFEEEPLPAGHPLWAIDSIILTPHNAGGSTVRNKARVVSLFVDNLKRYLADDTASMINLVDYRKKY
jgi:phosphoglycerate dehydrogenase-like enzyme